VRRIRGEACLVSETGLCVLGVTLMNPFNILLAESSGQSCSDDRSHNLKSILETSALGSRLRVYSLCLDRLQTFPSEPDLVVLRFGPALHLAWRTLIGRLQGWKGAKLIGAFCGNTNSRDIAQSLEWGLVDYVLCPLLHRFPVSRRPPLRQVATPALSTAGRCRANRRAPRPPTRVARPAAPHGGESVRPPHQLSPHRVRRLLLLRPMARHHMIGRRPRGGKSKWSGVFP